MTEQYIKDVISYLVKGTLFGLIGGLIYLFGIVFAIIWLPIGIGMILAGVIFILISAVYQIAIACKINEVK